MRKFLIGTAIVIVALVAGVFIYLKTRKLEDFEPLIKERLQSMVLKASDSLYTIKVDKISGDILTSNVTLVNIKLTPNMDVWERLNLQKRAPADVFDVTIDGLAIDGLQPSELANAKNIHLDVLYIKDPKIIVTHMFNKPKNDSASSDTSTLYQKIAKNFDELGVKKLVLTNVDLTSINNVKKGKPFKVSNVNIDLTNILINASTQYDSSRFLFAENAHINLTKFSINTADNIYKFAFDSLDIETGKKQMLIKNVGFVPRYDKEEFSKKLEFYKDRYTIEFKSVICNNIDWYSLVLNEGLFMDEMLLNNGTFQVYGDRTMKFDHKSKIGNYPQQMLMQSGLPIYIPKIKASNTTISYTEKNSISTMEGALLFTDASGEFDNVTNMPEVYNTKPLMKLDATAKLMDKGSFDAKFTFNLPKYKNGNFTVQMDLGAMDGQALQAPAEKLGQFKINSLKINKLHTFITGDNINTTGNIEFLYDDLDMDLLKAKEENGKMELKKRGLISFIANAFVIKKSNPLKGETRKKTMQLRRVPEISFFGFIWKTILDGMLQTMAGKKTDVAKPVS